MRMLTISVLMIIRTLYASDYHPHDLPQSGKPIIYFYSAKSFKNRPSDTRPYLKVSYDGSKNGYCKIAFRVFLLKNKAKIAYSVDSKHYLGSYASGESCTETFLVPLSKKQGELKNGSFYFHIIPIDFDGKAIAHNLEKDFNISMQFR